jgi:phospholipid:diacylglycerol acyltransferase
MNILRQRNVGANALSSTRSGPPSQVDTPKTPSNDHTDFRILPAEKLHELVHKPKGQKRQKAWIFGLGGIFGLVIAALFANQNQMLDLAALQDINLESIIDILPAGILSDARNFQVSSDSWRSVERQF